MAPEPRQERSAFDTAVAGNCRRYLRYVLDVACRMLGIVGEAEDVAGRH